MTSVPIPLRVRVAAYAVTMAPLDSLVVWVVAEHHADTATGVLLAALVSSLHAAAGVLALSHLTLPDDPTAGRRPPAPPVLEGDLS